MKKRIVSVKQAKRGRKILFNEEFFKVMKKLHNKPDDREAIKSLAQYINKFRKIQSWNEEKQHRFFIEVWRATRIRKGALTKKGVSVYKFFDVVVKKYSTQETGSLVNKTFTKIEYPERLSPCELK